MLKYFRILVFFVFVVTITSCSQYPFRGHITNIQTAILLNTDAEVTTEQVKNTENDVALVRSGPRATAIVAKRFDEYGKTKWISEDRAMLVINDSRLIKTIGFNNDLLMITADNSDPLKELDTINGKQWQWLVDTEEGLYGHLVKASYQSRFATLEILDTNYETLYVIEDIQFGAQSLFNFKNSWQNHYWFSSSNGKLLKTIQQASPDTDDFEITFVSTAIKEN